MNFIKQNINKILLVIIYIVVFFGLSELIHNLLYNYVTDYYQCSECGFLSSETHIASSNISDEQIDNIEKMIVAYVNQLRTSNGLCELWTDTNWNAWADTRSRELAILYGHNRPDGKQFSDGWKDTFCCLDF